MTELTQQAAQPMQMQHLPARTLQIYSLSTVSLPCCMQVEAASAKLASGPADDEPLTAACRSFIAEAAPRCEALAADYQQCLNELRSLSEYFQVIAVDNSD